MILRLVHFAHLVHTLCHISKYLHNFDGMIFAFIFSFDFNRCDIATSSIALRLVYGANLRCYLTSTIFRTQILLGISDHRVYAYIIFPLVIPYAVFNINQILLQRS